MPARRWLQGIESDAHVSTAAAAAGVAPPQWRVREVCIDKVEDRWGWALQRYVTTVKGRLWWKHKKEDWITVETKGDWSSTPDMVARKDLLTLAWETFLKEMRHGV